MRDKVKWTWKSIEGLYADFFKAKDLFANWYECQIENDVYDKNLNLCGSTLLCQMTPKNLNSMTKQNL